MGIFNVFRILGDVSHMVSISILLWSIHVNKSAEGVSLITQVLYAFVFCTRYLDLFWVKLPKDAEGQALFYYNTVLKILYISTSLYIIYIMMRKFARTRERELSWKLGVACLGGALLLAPFTMMMFVGRKYWAFERYLWVFSIILESVCVLPQLLLLRQTSVPTVIDSFYLLTLGCYRAFYICNWIERWATANHPSDLPDAISVIFGCIQTLLYVDFAWVYWTRQRVKLRNGAVVDNEDLSRGFLVNKILGGSVPVTDEEDAFQNRPSNWGANGISVSADDEPPAVVGRTQQSASARGRSANGEAPLSAEEATGMLSAPDAFEDEDEDDEVDGTLPSSRPAANSKDVGDGEEWRD